MRHATILVAVLAFVPLTVTVVGCDLELFGPGEGSREPGSLEAWRVENFYRGAFQSLECPTRFDIFLQGASPSDARPWAVGASVEVEPLFDRPCGLFTKCLLLNATFSTSSQNAWQIRGLLPTNFQPRARVDAVAPGVGRIAVSVDGKQFGEVELRALSPQALQVDRLVADAQGIPGALEPLGDMALATDGFAPIVTRLFDASGTHLCGTPTVSATASGLTVVGTSDTLVYPGLRANGVVTLQGDSTTGPATVTLSVGDASTTIDLDVVDVTAITSVEGLLLGSLPFTAYIRVRSLAGQQEVAGTLVQLENLTPDVYEMFNQRGNVVTVLITRESAVRIFADSAGTSRQGQVRLSVSGTAIAPVVFEFTVPVA
jgi:hypothetical protein